MTTLENLKSNENITWILNNSEITDKLDDCYMTHFTGRVPSSMLSNLRSWFELNGASRCGGSVAVGLGSVNLYTSNYKGDNKITFTACLAKNNLFN